MPQLVNDGIIALKKSLCNLIYNKQMLLFQMAKKLSSVGEAAVLIEFIMLAIKTSLMEAINVNNRPCGNYWGKN